MAKETIKKMKRQLIEWKKISANNISDKWLISKIYKELLQLNCKIQSYFNMGRSPVQTFFQRRHPNGQQVHEKMLNIINHQGNASQNHSEISPHTCQNGYYPKKKR